VFPADAANLIFCSAQQVTSLSFVHNSIMARFRLPGLSGCITLIRPEVFAGQQRQGLPASDRRFRVRNEHGSI